MKFGKELKKQKVPEWTEAYTDYNGLKRLLHEIQKKGPSLNRLRAPPRQAKQFRDSSGLNQHGTIVNNLDDIENQVIAVQSVQQENSRKLYNTKFLIPPEEGEESEIIFFKKLDDELNKTNNFYKDKVEEVLAEAASLKKQMDALVALRIKVMNRDIDGSNSLRILSTDVNNLTPSKITSPGIRKMGRTFAVEMSSKLEPGSSSEADVTDQMQGSDIHVISSTENCVAVSEDGENNSSTICETDHLRILDRVKISNTYYNPMSTIKGVWKDSREKGLSYNKEELKEVEHRLRNVFVGFYQKLCLLKNFSFMNLSAFSKILKKYEKITSRSVARSYMKIVENSYIGSSDEVTCLMETVEVVFIKNFLNSNRREGMKLLRPKLKRELHRITFLSGFFSGCSIALLVAAALLIEDRNLIHQKSAVLYIYLIFPLYSFYIFIVLHLLVYAANIYLWRRYRINHPFIFGFKQGTEFSYREVFLLSNGLAVIALATFLVHLHIKMDSTTQRYETYIELLPLGLVIVVLAILLFPFNILYRSSRFFFIKCIFHCVCAPLYKVTFPDFFLADQFTSQIQAIRSFEYYVCFYGGGKLSRKWNACSNHDVYNIFYFIVAVIPYWFRFMQCVRRLFEEKDFAHGYNSIRYFLTIVAVVIRTAFEREKTTAWKVSALVSSFIATIANTYWDIVVDWGLLQRKSKNFFLRDKLLVSNKNIYFIAMIMDVLLRFAWLQLVLTFDVHSLRGKTISTIFSCLEILRRGMWNFFRLENEHLNNVGRYRAFKSVPLPFTYYDDEDALRTMTRMSSCRIF